MLSGPKYNQKVVEFYSHFKFLNISLYITLKWNELCVIISLDIYIYMLKLSLNILLWLYRIYANKYLEPIRYKPSGLPWWLSGKESVFKAGYTWNAGLVPGLGRYYGERNGSPLQYSCLEIPKDSGVWKATAHGSQKVRHDWAPKHAIGY